MSKGLAIGYTDNDRIMQSVVRGTTGKPGLKFWLQTGTKDELSDRNNNGIIDSIDDTIALIEELEKKGYSRPADIQYIEVVGGGHDTENGERLWVNFCAGDLGNRFCNSI